MVPILTSFVCRNETDLGIDDSIFLFYFLLDTDEEKEKETYYINVLFNYVLVGDVCKGELS